MAYDEARRRLTDAVHRAPARNSGWIDPVHAFRCFAHDPAVIFLNSAGPATSRARLSRLCLDPVAEIRVDGATVTLDGSPTAADPFALIETLQARHGTQAAGFIGYEMGATLDRAQRAPGTLPGIPDMLVRAFGTVLTFDHERRQLTITAANERCDMIRARLARGASEAVRAADDKPKLHWRAATSRNTHIGRVRRILRYIQDGDIYQANLAAIFEAPRPEPLDPAALFLQLSNGNPAPFSAYIGCGHGCAVLSVSPERFLHVDAAGAIETRPIKGTRKRAADPAHDAALAADLLASEKDRAENLMIVDLLRNDIARVADKVSVPALNALESFAHVHHLVSTVRGQLQPSRTAMDLLRAAFPGGSITGAPKLRAMDIIAELEQRARGPYCGSAIWIGEDGALDSNILIRTMTVAHDRIVAQAGGGIVADSDPAAEWDEVLVKIMPLLLATGTVELS